MKKVYLLVTSIIVLVVGSLLFLRREARTKNDMPTIQTSLISEEIKPSDVASVATSSRGEHTTAITSMRKTTPDTNAYQQKMLSMWQSPIDFYGRVMDENGNPVEGADIVFSWSELPAYEGSGNSFATKSDAKGLFSLTGKRGPNLIVRAGMDGYYTSRNDQTGFSYALGDESFRPDSLNPVVFHLKKKRQGVNLITSENGIRTDVAVRTPKNDIAVWVDLLEKKLSPTGHLEISQIKPPWRDATNWSFRLNIPEGGFVENQDEFQFEAPKSNYLPSVEYSFSKGDTNWTTQATKQFYIVFGQPRKYGWLRIESNLAQETVFLTYAINPTGGRNLEPK